MRRIVTDRRFALLELILVLLNGAIWMLKPGLGVWFVLIALLPWVMRLMSGMVPFRRTIFDWLILVFLISAWIGYWAAYDKTTAWNKVWFIMTGILFYYALNAQPRSNLVWISVFFVCIGVGTSMFYFITYDFVTVPRKLELTNQIGRWIMSVRPQFEWNSVHPNYAAGITAITVPFFLYPIWKLRNRPVPFFLLVFMGLCVALFVLFMTTSRGAIMAIASGLGGLLLWRLFTLNGIRDRLGNEAVFSSIILIYLCAVVAFLYIGPANSGSVFVGSYNYGNGSRSELFLRSLYLVLDYPFTGGGLSAFPGLYSQYILNIPFFYVPNSHNLFLDVAIEQGMFGGLSFLFIHVAAIWVVSRSMMQETENEGLIFKGIVFFSLIVAVVHGTVDDYLYNDVGSLLSLCLVGLVVHMSPQKGRERRTTYPYNTPSTLAGVALLMIGAILVGGNKILSMWYANIGAVQMSQVELNGFPNNGWAGSEIVPRLDVAESTLQSALRFDPANRTANQRLGMISMLRRDFSSAVVYLNVAHIEAPRHRGIIKSLGFSYTWLGETDNAVSFLAQIPEAKNELDAYYSWWMEQGRSDFSEKAVQMHQVLETLPAQP